MFFMKLPFAENQQCKTNDSQLDETAYCGQQRMKHSLILNSKKHEWEKTQKKNQKCKLILSS